MNTTHLSNRLILLLISLFLVGCNPIFVIRAAYEQSKILLARQPIEDVIAAETTTDLNRQKFQLVLLARVFSQEMGLELGDSFTQFTQLQRHPPTWVISASKKTSFEPYLWWFPIVGSVPYKGFFDRSDALAEAKTLEEKGFETWVRGAAAFSTLGWFNDPLLSSTLELSPGDLVNTVIHESVHSTFWIPGSVKYNESLANFVGSQGQVDFFDWLKGRQDSPLTEAQRVSYRNEAKVSLLAELAASEVLQNLFSELSAVYSSQNLNEEEKLARRALIYAQHMQAISAKFPGFRLLSAANNAELLQNLLYRSNLSSFQRFKTECGLDWPGFIEYQKNMAKRDSSEEEMFVSLGELKCD